MNPAVIAPLPVAAPRSTPPPKFICPRCERLTLRLKDSEKYAVPARRGSVLLARTYQCEPCAINIRTVQVCVGEVMKASLSRNGKGAAPKYLTVCQASEPLVIFNLL